MTKLGQWLVVVLLMGTFVTVAGWFLHERGQRGRGLPAFSVYSNEGDGLGEAAYLLKQLGWAPTAITRPLPFDNHTGLLFIVLDDPAQLRKIEARGLLRWVGNGNTLVFACAEQTDLHTLLDLTVTPASQREEVPFAVEPLRTGRFTDDYTDNVNTIGLVRPTTVKGDNAYPLWQVSSDPGAVVLRHGNGRVIALADPFVLTRVGLHESDNVVFLNNLVALHAEDRVYFDEYHHGFHSTGGFWGYLEHHDSRWALVPLLLVVAMLLWRGAVRLGPAAPVPEPKRADTVDYATALAGLYQKAGTHVGLAQSLAIGFLHTLTSHLRLRPTALPMEVLVAWRKKHGETSANKLQPLLRLVGEFRRGEVDERKLLHAAQAFDGFAKENLG